MVENGQQGRAGHEGHGGSRRDCPFVAQLVERVAATRCIAEFRVADRGIDLLQVDLYDRAARGPVLDDEPFYAACRGLLRGPGVAAFNLFGRGFEPSFARIAAAFDDRALVLPEADAGNRIVLAFNGPPLEVAWPALYARAREVERQFGLPARKWVSGLRGQAAGAAALAV